MILGITSAFYIYLLQRFKGQFLKWSGGWDGEDKDLRFERPSEHFWLFLVFTLLFLIFFLISMFGASTSFFTGQKLDELVAIDSIFSALDLIWFGYTMKEFAEYPDKLRRFLMKYEVYELPNGSRIIKKKTEDQ